MLAGAFIAPSAQAALARASACSDCNASENASAGVRGLASTNATAAARDLLVRIEQPVLELLLRIESLVPRQLKDRLRAGLGVTRAGLDCESIQLALDRRSYGLSAQPGIVHVDGLHTGGYGGSHRGKAHRVVARREIHNDRFTFTVVSLHLPGRYARLHPYRPPIAGIRRRIKSLHIIPLAAELYPFQHALPLEHPENIRADALGLDIEKEPDIVLPRLLQHLVKLNNPHPRKPLTHPAAGIE